MIFAALSIVFAILFFCYSNYFYLVLIVASLFLSFKRHKVNVFIASCIILFIFCIFRFNYFNESTLSRVTNEFNVIEDYNGYVILENCGNKFVYYDENDLNKGNHVSIKGEIKKLDKENDFHKYLATQKIYYVVEGKVTFNDNNVTFSSKIINYLLKNKDENNKRILKLMLFNIKDESNASFYKYFETFSLNFLVVISGFHINLLFKVLKKTKGIKYVIIGGYLILLDLSVSSLKAFIYIVLKKVNKSFKWRYNNFDLLSFILIAMLFVNPSYCFNLGFIYTFIFSYAIDLINNIIDSKKLGGKLLVKLLIFFTSLPLIIMSNHEINMASFFMVLLFEFPISVLFVFSLLYLFFDKFYLLYKLSIFIIEFIFKWCLDWSFNLVFGKPSSVIIVMLYLSLFLMLYFYQNRMRKISYCFLFLYVFVLGLQYSIPILDSRETVYFIDVGQGDCIGLKIPNSKTVVLIDTGGNKYRDVALKDIIPFLKERGINYIEKIVITHDDFDHNGGCQSLINNFNVGKIIESSNIEKVQIGDKEFVNLNKKEGRENDDSIVLYGRWGDINYLFTGDISSEVEKEIIDNYNLSIDILKVSHHGSNTSSSIEFIEKLKPKVALIGVGKNNKYGHPCQDVIDVLLFYGVKIFRSDYHGNIIIYKSLFTNSIIIEKEKDMI